MSMLAKGDVATDFITCICGDYNVSRHDELGTGSFKLKLPILVMQLELMTVARF